jgi:hypothetical protein
MMNTKKTVKILAYKSKKSGSLLARLISFLLGSDYYHFEIMLDDIRVVARLGQRSHLEEFNSKVQELIMDKQIKVIYLPPISETDFHEVIYYIKDKILNKKYDFVSLMNNHFFKVKKDWDQNKYNCIDSTLKIINYIYRTGYNESDFRNILNAKSNVWKMYQ